MTAPADKSGLVDSNGQSIYYEIHGEGEPLVLIMGIGYDATLWGLHQIPELSKHYQVIVFDNRDVGRSSPAAKPYTIADMADDTAGLLDALDIDRAHVLGLSMGGMIAQELALRHPGKVDKLILTGTGAGAARAKFDAISTWAFVKSHDAAGLDFAAQQFVWLFSEDFLRNHEAVGQTLEMLGSNPNPVGAEAYQRQADAYVQHDTLDRLAAIRAQTLVISGERDRLTPPWVCKEVADGVPGAELTVVDGPGSSHVLPLERPSEFNALVASFLGNGSKS
jgi:pimeloyl-ACP methyl ester carboxylesterase